MTFPLWRSALAVCALLILCTSVHAAPPPGWPFRVLQTDHFEIVYREDQKALAKRYALASEQAYELLIPIFKEAPKKTIIFISDETDSSNGMATFLPYPMIYVYPVLPSSTDSIDDYGDWPLEMIVHEYTHILNMYPAHGMYVPLKWIFGSVIRPNAVLPKWYLEGLAVNNESRLTDHGRLRTSETQAQARALVLGNRLRQESLPDINEQDLTTWPYGSRPYLFGGWWWNQVQSEHGEAVIETWNQNFARRIPFFLNGPMEEQTKRSAEGLLASTAENLEKQAQAELSKLNSNKVSTGTAVASEDGEQSIFAVSPSGEYLVYWLGKSQKRGSEAHLSMGSEVRLKRRTSATEPWLNLASTRLFNAPGSLRVRWIDDLRFVYDQIDIITPNTSYRDLYVYDLKTGQSERLTIGQRAQEPAPSPKGDKIAFIQNDGGFNRLMLLTTATRQVKKLLTANLNQRLSGPEFINENEILFSLRQRSGLENLYVYSLSERKTRLWNEDLTSAQNARLTSKGVMVTDAHTNVRNVYLARAGKRSSQPISNTQTDIESVDFDPQRNEVIVSELSGDGRRLMSFPLAQFTPPSIDPVKIPPPPKSTLNKISVREESYQPIEYLLPHYWIPFVYPVENGLLFQGSTGSADPAGRNQYSLFGSYDTITQKPSYGISYVNSSLPTDIGLSYGKSVSYLGASGYILESQNAALSLTNTWPFNSRHTHWSVGGVWMDTQSGTTTYRRMGPSAGVQYSRMQHPLNSWLGVYASLGHDEFMPADNDYLTYGRTTSHLATNIQLGGGHHIVLNARGAFAPRLPMRDVISLGDRSIGGNYLVSLTNSDFLLRGYSSGSFVGRKLINANLEYALPLVQTIGGWGTFPVFLKDVELAVFADAMSVDGGAYDPERDAYLRSSLNRFFMGTGGELRINSTTGYHLPISLILGGYYGLNSQFGGGFMPFLGLGLGSLGALQNKTP